MFTGIVEELGEVVDLEMGADSARLRLRGPLVVSDAQHGASISVSGVCLTVTDHDAETFAVDVMAETLRRSSLGALQVGDRVNLERAMAADGRFGGHVVQGHVDGVGAIRARTPGDRWEVVEIDVPADLAHYVVVKGSVTIDGVSLTVSALHDRDDGTSLEVSLIPTTLALTTLGSRQVGDPVNLEVDVLAKYVERLLGARDGSSTPAAPVASAAEGDLA
ncbi:riboflavin synthase [Dermatophilaceae bacterium Soc4.6]